MRTFAFVKRGGNQRKLDGAEQNQGAVSGRQADVSERKTDRLFNPKGANWGR